MPLDFINTRKIKRALNAAFVLALGSSLLACTDAKESSSPITPAPAPVAETVEPAPIFDTQAMDQLLSSAVETGEVPGVSALIFDEGRVVYTGAFGMGDMKSQSPVTRDSVFRIYSMTKPITSALILDLQEEGLLNINDPASKYIPQLGNMKVATLGPDGKPTFVDQITPMTVKDLLLHRAGLAYGIFGDLNAVEVAYAKAGVLSPDEGLAAKMDTLGKLPLVAQPGTAWYYSYSIDVLGAIAEVVTGETLSDLMQARFFTPLDMVDTGFFVRPDQATRFVSNYALNKNGEFELQDGAQNSEFLRERAFESGGGGLVSTLDDYAKFAELMLNKGDYKGTRILESDTVKTMMSNQLDPDDIALFPWILGNTNAAFGYGGSVQIASDEAQILQRGKAKGQWGWSGAANTNFWVDPDSNAFGIIFLQFFSPEDPDLHNRFRSLAYQETRQK